MIRRRDFVKAGGVAAALLAFEGRSWARAGPDAGGRLIVPLNTNWRFSPRPDANATARDFDDSGFEQVTIPHSNIRLPWHSFDDRAYQFVSVYRRRFRLPNSLASQHIFLDFAGAMTASTVWLNGKRVGEYKGGYTPFSFELTPGIDFEGENVLAVELDSGERPDIPPFGGSIDYLTFGGIYRDVSLRIVAGTYLANLFARARDALSGSPVVEVSCFLNSLERETSSLVLEAELQSGNRVLASARRQLRGREPGSSREDLRLAGFGRARPWQPDDPSLYTVVVRLRRQDHVVDQDQRRIGFREASFTETGFVLNGKPLKLRGLNHHQTFPFVGPAMPARVQRRDAWILKKQLKCNIVRTSHYPQSPHFLDACDELGLLVLEEIPGWQHIGDQAWQDLSVDNVRRMIERDWNHPAIILWGVRINESRDNHDFYERTNALAHSLDPSRPTCGIRNNYQSELLEDVFTMNDFGFPLRPPNHPRYLNTEFVGHTYPTKPYDNVERLTEHILRHARVHDQLASDPRYAGGLGWCAFDYNTHNNFGSGDRVCYHGVSDIFRLPKPAAAFYQSQCDPAEEVVLEPAFQWSARSDFTDVLEKALVCSNCDHLKFYVNERLVAEADPDRASLPHLPHPPFRADLNRKPPGNLRIEGYLGDRKVVERSYSAAGVDRQFAVAADDRELVADGSDATRVVFSVTDEFGSLRRFSSAAIRFELEGPADLIGDNPFSLVGGAGAVWLRARLEPGQALLKVIHPVLGTRQVSVQIRSAGQQSI